MPSRPDEIVSLHYAAVPAQPWAALADLWLPRLTAVKRAAILRLREPADRNASLLGIALLGAALEGRAIAFEPEALEFPVRGKPRLAAGPDFSIAHASGYVGCALASVGRVGFDVEARDAVGTEALRVALGPPERELLVHGALDPTAAWVMTEAVLKAAARGIDASARVRLAGEAATLDGVPFRLAAVAVAAGCVAFVAHEGAGLAMQVVRHEPSEFAPLP